MEDEVHPLVSGLRAAVMFRAMIELSFGDSVICLRHCPASQEKRHRKNRKKSKSACSPGHFLAPGSARDYQPGCGHVMLHGHGRNPVEVGPGKISDLPQPPAKSPDRRKDSARWRTR
jgi:hypothetical protein